ncbi:MAG TPA: aminoglycoside 3'-phosphotransferase [Streptosporangiaceae bacterium]|nr:aminoglycoside 3'-phosphotransferase [Streptosporangiaceae bacterium]
MSASSNPEQREVPPAVGAVVGRRAARVVWENELGGLTFEVGSGQDRCFVKWSPAASGIDLAHEAARLTWAHAFTPVPRVLDHGADETGAWLTTTALPGSNAVSPCWLADPKTAVHAIGEGLRAMHDALPAATCPFSWRAADRVARAHRRAAAGELNAADWEGPGSYGPAWDSLGTAGAVRAMSLDEALTLAGEPPPVDRLAVCHGDACAPNTLLTGDGCWSGHVDLGELGTADIWADLAVATWSTQWNYGPGWEGELLAAYGIAPDPDRIRYYRMLWTLDP